MAMPEAQLSTVRAILEELIRSVLRLELAVQRNFENVNITRHSVNGELQKLFIDVGMVHSTLKDVLRKVDESNLTMAAVKELSTQSKGGMKVFHILWPLLLALGSFVIGNYTGWKP